MKMKFFFFTTLCAAALFLFACNKESNTSTFRIRMTDAPTDLDEVNVDLREVRIKFARDTNSWLQMETRAGIYNLLDLQNGVDTLIAQGDFPQDNVKEIRLILGSNNTVKSDGQVYPLTIPSGSESGLKIKINKKLSKSIDSLVIDFDAALSVRREAEGYKLRPVIKVK